MPSLRRLLIAAALAIVALAGVRLWCVDGLFRRITIDGPSMAPALCGAHYDVTCQDCGFHFPIDADQPPSDSNAACPNCGFDENRLAQAALRTPNRVVVDKWPLLWQKPIRGEIIAARAPTEEIEFVVKRVAAGPSETLSIAEGDLFVNEQPIRKTLTELRAVRQLVHDNDFQPRPAAKLPPRWRGSGADSRWAVIGAGFRLPAASSASSALDWLEYQHWPCTANAQLRGTLAPIRDNDSYNQGPASRELNAVSDVVLSCHVRCRGAGQLAFAGMDGQQRFEIIVETGKDVRVLVGGQQSPARVEAINILQRNGMEIEFGFCDRQLLFVVDGYSVVGLPYERPSSLTDTLHPLAIGARGVEVEVTHLRVWRDIYYLDPQALSRPWQAAAPLQAGEMLLFGDNQPLSIDSRQWEPRRVLTRTVLGKVYRPFWVSE